MKKLLIVFIKNKKLGKVKTRLANSIGDELAFEVYEALIHLTEQAIKGINEDKIIYFSDDIDDSIGENYPKAIQKGNDLGEKMKNAFEVGFNKGYHSIVLIGSDLPDMSEALLNKAFKNLENSNTVFGAAKDGGYYLIGMNKMYPFVFDNKPWSQDLLLEITLQELQENKVNFSLLETLNDIDTFEDLKASNLFVTNVKLQQKIQNYHDK